MGSAYPQGIPPRRPILCLRRAPKGSGDDLQARVHRSDPSTSGVAARVSGPSTTATATGQAPVPGAMMWQAPPVRPARRLSRLRLAQVLYASGITATHGSSSKREGANNAADRIRDPWSLLAGGRKFGLEPLILLSSPRLQPCAPESSGHSTNAVSRRADRSRSSPCRGLGRRP